MLNEQSWTLDAVPAHRRRARRPGQARHRRRDRNHAGQGSLQRHGRQQAARPPSRCRPSASRKVDSSELEAICKELVAANPKIVADVKGGKQQAVGALVGQAKKKNPNANPNDVRRICLELIEKM